MKRSFRYTLFILSILPSVFLAADTLLLHTGKRLQGKLVRETDRVYIFREKSAVKRVAKQNVKKRHLTNPASFQLPAAARQFLDDHFVHIPTTETGTDAAGQPRVIDSFYIMTGRLTLAMVKRFLPAGIRKREVFVYDGEWKKKKMTAPISGESGAAVYISHTLGRQIARAMSQKLDLPVRLPRETEWLTALRRRPALYDGKLAEWCDTPYWPRPRRRPDFAKKPPRLRFVVRGAGPPLAAYADPERLRRGIPPAFASAGLSVRLVAFPPRPLTKPDKTPSSGR